MNDCLFLSSENRDRTCDLRVMSPTSYRCSISRCGCKCTANSGSKQTSFAIRVKVNLKQSDSSIFIAIKQ